MSINLKGATADATIGTGMVVFGADSNNAAAPSLYSLATVKGVVDPRAYGATFNGTTDDTTAIQAAITAAGDGIVEFPHKGNASVTALTLNAASKIRGNGSTLTLRSGNGPVISIPDSAGLQVNTNCWIQDLQIDGVTTAAGTVGVAIANNAETVLTRCNVRQCEVGVRILAGQFGVLRDCRLRLNTIGLYLKSPDGVGGGNSWSFYDCMFDNNEVGTLANGQSIYPHGGHLYRGCMFHGNACAAMALVNAQNIVWDGNAPEFNADPADGAETITYDSITVKRAMLHAVNSVVTITDWECAEAQAAIACLLETGSQLTLHNVTGYGRNTEYFAQCDATSSIALSGSFNALASTDGVVSIQAALNHKEFNLAVVSHIHPIAVAQFPNMFATSQNTAFGDINGAASETTGTDAVYGAFRSVTFVATAGSQNSNHLRMSLTPTGPVMAVAVTMQSDIDCTLSFRVFNNLGPKHIRLQAGVWSRVFWATESMPTELVYFYAYPETTGGAVLKCCQWQAVSGADSPALRAQINQMFQGVWASTA